MKLKQALLLSAFAGLGLTTLSGCATLFVGAAATTAGVAISSDSRPIEVMAYDDAIEQDSYKILKSNKILSNSEKFSVAAVVVYGNVLLVGQSTDMNYLNWCVGEIKKLGHVRKVYNYVENKLPVSAQTVANDTLITSKVKAKLLLSDNVKSGRFKVYTEDSNVYLMGYVTRDEAKRAINQVLTINGIKKIYTIFDYFDQPTLNADKPTNDIVVQPVDIQNTNQNVYNNNSAATGNTQTINNGGAVIVDDTSLESM